LSQKAIPHNARVPAQSLFYKQLTEKRENGGLFHILAAKRSPVFHYDLPETTRGQLNLFAGHNFSKPQRGFVDTLYDLTMIEADCLNAIKDYNAP
jgi:hypothetical protein